MKDQPIESLTERVAALVPAMRQHAGALDRSAGFPVTDIAALRSAGALSIELPIRNRPALDRLTSLLISLGSGNLAVGRVYEAHVNALNLIGLFGTASQICAARQAAAAGGLYALWVTDPAGGAVHLHRVGDRFELQGSKVFCSAAGHAAHALVTAEADCGGQQMLLVPLQRGERVDRSTPALQGMRSAQTGAVDFSGVVLPGEALLGGIGDYLKEPAFSCGAWRGSAVALGGLCALLDESVAELRARGRLDNPHQLSRVGDAFIARETARHWVDAAARKAELEPSDAEASIAHVGLARIAVETACLDAMRLLQRSLGLSAFRQSHPVERICRDLGTYLRQPAPDEVLVNAASWFARAQPAIAT